MFLNTAAWRTCGCPSLKGHQTRLDGALGRLVSQEFSGPMGRVEAGWCLKPLPTSVILWLVPILLAHHSRNFPLSTSCKVSLFSFSHLSHESKKKKTKTKPKPCKVSELSAADYSFHVFSLIFMYLKNFWSIISLFVLFAAEKLPNLLWNGQAKNIKYRKCNPEAVQKDSKTLLQISGFFTKKILHGKFFFCVCRYC